MSGDPELREMSLDQLLDERVTLRIRINLIEHDGLMSLQPIDVLKGRLAQLERVITEQRKLEDS